ncbi:MAG: carboxypeptidase-like regulatory domain-containing protein, partial [Chitinophagaceae bacterium]
MGLKNYTFHVLCSSFYKRALPAILLVFSMFLLSANATAQDRQITGQVLSETGDGLAGASVQVENSTVGTNTDSLGNFALAVPAGARLVVSYVGYTSQTVTIGDRTNVVVVLAAAGSSVLEQVVVVGYG